MATTTKRTKAKRNIYLKRKARSNARIKAQVFDVRIIVQKSNKYISAQAVSASGEII
jgi:ribosomal protein L18